MIEAFSTIGIAIFIGIVGGIIEVYYDNKKEKQQNKATDINTECIDRFGTDYWDLRTGRHYD